MNHQLSATEPTASLRSTLVQLCNPTNLRIIHLLHRENITMNFVVSRKLGITSQLTSKRLKALTEVGLLIQDKIFKRKYYRLNLERFSDLGLSVELLIQDLA